VKPSSKKLKMAIVGAFVVLAVGILAVWTLTSPQALSFAGSRSIALTAYEGPSPTGVPAELRSADIVTRGKYLTEAADCEVCHTSEGAQPFSGGRAFPTPFGTLYSPNITADRDTGIGNWSDADFVAAMHRGIAKDGRRLYPAFPYPSYTLIADEDVRAIKAYLFSLPAAHAAAPPNRLIFPFNQRWLMRIWSGLYNPDHRFQPVEDRSPEWNRGAYLVEGLGHCGDCHTPRNLAQALDNRHKFEGAVISGWHAYNITPDPVSGLGQWTDTELLAYLHDGHALGRGSAGGPMAEVVDESLSRLAPADLHAIAVYLRAIPAMRSSGLPAPKTSPASDIPERLEADVDPRGKRIFAGACASCHGWSGVSLLSTSATLTGVRAVNDPAAVNVAQIVLSGGRPHPSDSGMTMPGFGAAYSDIEIAALVNYVTGRFGAAPSHLTAREIADFRRMSPH
jgi:mono/diheme cytochrome c family protein